MSFSAMDGHNQGKHNRRLLQSNRDRRKHVRTMYVDSIKRHQAAGVEKTMSREKLEEIKNEIRNRIREENRKQWRRAMPVIIAALAVTALILAIAIPFIVNNFAR